MLVMSLARYRHDFRKLHCYYVELPGCRGGVESVIGVWKIKILINAKGHDYNWGGPRL
jgi:hypothetical protein